MTAPANPETVRMPMRAATSMARSMRKRADSVCLGVERILVIGANGRDADASVRCVGGQLVGERLPIRVRRCGGGLGKAHPLHGAQAQLLRPSQFIGPA